MVENFSLHIVNFLVFTEEFSFTYEMLKLKLVPCRNKNWCERKRGCYMTSIKRFKTLPAPGFQIEHTPHLFFHNPNLPLSFLSAYFM